MVVLGENLRRSHIAPLTAALPCHGGVKGHSHKTVLCHFLRIKAGGLLFHCTKWPGNHHRLVLFADVKVLGKVQMPCHIETITVLETYILDFDGLVHGIHASVIGEVADGGTLHLGSRRQSLGRCCSIDCTCAAKSHCPCHQASGNHKHGFFLGAHFHR